MKISIVIPNYNGIKYLKDCIDSIKKQTYLEYEIIIIDNASSDDLYSWIKNDKSIIFKRLDQNYGFSRAVNEGIHISKGEYVLLLNNDTVLESNFLEKIIEYMSLNKNIFAISSKMVQYNNPQLIDDVGDEYTILGWTLRVGDGKDISQYNFKREVFSACAGAALYRKEVFAEIGYFDESFFAYMEDVDISYRARIYGYKNIYCPDAKVYHIGSATSGSKYNSFKVKLAARNNIYVPYKNMPILQLILNFPFLILGFFIKYLFFMKKGYGKDYRDGIVEGIFNLKNLKKIPFRFKNLKNYIHIELLLVINTFKYVFSKIIK